MHAEAVCMCETFWAKIHVLLTENLVLHWSALLHMLHDVLQVLEMCWSGRLQLTCKPFYMKLLYIPLQRSWLNIEKCCRSHSRWGGWTVFVRTLHHCCYREPQTYNPDDRLAHDVMQVPYRGYIRVRENFVHNYTIDYTCRNTWTLYKQSVLLYKGFYTRNSLQRKGHTGDQDSF